MKRTKHIFFIFLSALFFVFASFPASAQEDMEELLKKAREVDRVYWFYLRVKVTRIDRRTNAYALITKQGSRIQSGDVETFEKSLWANTLKKRITVGPFWDEEEAENARILYSKDRISETEFKRERDYTNVESAEMWDRELYWFPISWEVKARPSSYKLIQMPTFVAPPGTTTAFLDALYENMNFGNLLIGPFWTMEEAENAIALYRLNE